LAEQTATGFGLLTIAVPADLPPENWTAVRYEGER